MTDAQIQSLIDAARTNSSDLVTWAELKEILEALKSQVSLTDLGTPVNGKVAKVVNGVWAQADDTGSGGGGGATTLDELSDVNVAGAADLTWLQKVSGSWVASALPTADLPSGLWGKTGSIIYPNSGEYISFHGVPVVTPARINHIGSGANQEYVSELLYPANAGTSYGAKGKAMYFSRGWCAFDSVNPSGRPNVVGTIWGYNHGLGGGRLDQSEPSFALRTETHFEVPGADLFELHLPTFMDLNNKEYRLCSWYTPKNGSSAGGPRYETDALLLTKWGDAVHGSYFFIQQDGRMSLKAVEGAGKPAAFPTIYLGSDLSTIQGNTSTLWNTRWEVQGSAIYFGHLNTSAALSDPTVRVHLYDNLWVGTVTGFGGNASTSRGFFLGGFQVIENYNQYRDALIITQPAEKERVAYIGATDTDYTLIANKAGAQIKAYGNYANDAAAATGGVPVNGIYRNGSTLQIRVS